MARTPAGQMAVDEALVLSAEHPILRFYRWAEPAATFGYAQRFDEVQRHVGDLPLVRRWTGGGIVFHGADLTLALAVPAGFELCQQRPDVIYHRIHQTLLAPIRETFPRVRLAEPVDCRPGPACFEAPALHDIISGGIKICGGALRRGRLGLLYQGSLHLDGSEHADAIGLAFSASVEPLLQTQLIEKTASQLENEKYATAEWNAMRRNMLSFQMRR